MCSNITKYRYKAKITNMRELSTTHSLRHNSGQKVPSSKLLYQMFKRQSYGKSVITYEHKERNSFSRNISQEKGKYSISNVLEL